MGDEDFEEDVVKEEEDWKEEFGFEDMEDDD